MGDRSLSWAHGLSHKGQLECIWDGWTVLKFYYQKCSGLHIVTQSEEGRMTKIPILFYFIISTRVIV